MRRFTSKNHVYENFDVNGIHITFAASFRNKILSRNRPVFNSKEKFGGYSVYSYSRIWSVERFLKVIYGCMMQNQKTILQLQKKVIKARTVGIPRINLLSSVVLHDQSRIFPGRLEYNTPFFPEKTHSAVCSHRGRITQKKCLVYRYSSLVFTLLSLFESDDRRVASPHTPPGSDGPLLSARTTSSQSPLGDSPVSYSSGGIV